MIKLTCGQIHDHTPACHLYGFHDFRRAFATMKLFYNLRASRQTELAATYPLHVVCMWIGNSAAIAQKHYLQITDADFENAAKSGTESGTVPARKTAQTGTDSKGQDLQQNEKTPEKPGVSLALTTAGQSGQFCGVPPRGLDTNNASHNSVNDLRQSSFSGAAESGAVAPESGPDDSELARLVEVWPTLSSADRAAIMAIVNKAP
jgi:hypothetical protein